VNQEQERAALDHCWELARRYEAYAKAPTPFLLEEVLASAHLIEKMWKGSTPRAESVINEGSIEAVVRGFLKETITCHGPITLNFVPSATKRVVRGLLGHLRQASVEDVSNAAAKAEVEKLRREVKALTEMLRGKQIEIRKLLERLGFTFGEKKEA
jgi:hypothetical protein